MPPTIHDILLLLGIVKSYSNNGSASHRYVTATFNDLPVRKAGSTDYSILEHLCVELGLLTIVGDAIRITPLGASLEGYSAKDPDLPGEFIKRVVLGPIMRKRIEPALLAFEQDEHGTYSYPKKDVYDLFSFPAIMPILYEIGLLEKDGSIVTINTEHAELAPRRITQANLENQLIRRKRIGDMGEKIAFEFEKARLLSMGCIREASQVKLISAEFANAGYDMESFDRDEDGKIHRIYVEIKSSAGRKIDFYWSANELKQAKTHAENYWIYFVPGIDEQTQRSPDEPVRLRDPYKTVFGNPSFATEPSQYRTFDPGSAGPK